MIHKIIDGTPVPANIRADFPNVSFPADLSIAALPEGYVWVVETPPPPCRIFERAEKAGFVLDGEEWGVAWSVVPWALEEIQLHLVNEIQLHLDATAQARAYDGILSLCTYATSPSPKFAAEGQSGVEWRDACWTKGYEILGECQAGLRPIPTPQELIIELPAMVWPE